MRKFGLIVFLLIFNILVFGFTGYNDLLGGCSVLSYGLKSQFGSVSDVNFISGDGLTSNYTLLTSKSTETFNTNMNTFDHCLSFSFYDKTDAGWSGMLGGNFTSGASSTSDLMVYYGLGKKINDNVQLGLKINYGIEDMDFKTSQFSGDLAFTIGKTSSSVKTVMGTKGFKIYPLPKNSYFMDLFGGLRIDYEKFEIGFEVGSKDYLSTVYFGGCGKYDFTEFLSVLGGATLHYQKEGIRLQFGTGFEGGFEVVDFFGGFSAAYSFSESNYRFNVTFGITTNY